MVDKIMTLLVGLLIALGGWSLSRTFELSTVQAVQEDKVNRLERHVDKLQNHIENMMKSDEEIMDQHKKLFEALEEGTSTSSGSIITNENRTRTQRADANEDRSLIDRHGRTRDLRLLPDSREAQPARHASPNA